VILTDAMPPSCECTAVPELRGGTHACCVTPTQEGCTKQSTPYADRPDSTTRFGRLGSRAGRPGRLHALPIPMHARCTAPRLCWRRRRRRAWLARKAGQFSRSWDAGRRNVNTPGVRPPTCNPLDWHEGLSRLGHASCRNTLCCFPGRRVHSTVTIIRALGIAELG
jgi:hypothetical protein